ncbi:hypothetical protein RI367_007292 [Sorochytrium milnesiophthora]
MSHAIEANIDDIRRDIQGASAYIGSVSSEKGAAYGTVLSPEDQRVLAIRHRVLLQQLYRATQLYRDVEAAQRQRVATVFRRQYRIVHPNATDDDIDELIHTDQISHNLFARNLLMSPANEMARVVKQDVIDRHQELLNLESSIEKLASLQLELSDLLQQQNEPIEQIVASIEQIQATAASADNDLEKAEVSARRARKMKWILLLIAVIVIGATLGIVLGITLHK